MDVAIVVFDGFDELDAIGPYEVFANAERAGADLTVTLRSMEDTGLLTASHGLQIQPDGRLAEVDPDLVVVPGGGWNDRDEAGAWAEAERGDLPRALAALHDTGTQVASVCTGAMILARAGLTDGRPAVTHHGAIEDLRDSGADVVDARVVDDGDLVTAGGVTSGIDLALHIVGREFGEDIASAVASQMEYDPRGSVHDKS